MNVRKAIGIDIGGTNFRIGTVDEEGGLENVHKSSSRPFCEDVESVAVLTEKIRDYIKENSLENQIHAIGIGFPSPVDAERKIVYNCANIQNKTGGFDGRNIVKYVEEELHIPTFINKDANNLLQYEIKMHQWKGKGITIGLYYGTGIGNSVYLNDRFLEGRHGVACDLGHIPFYLSDRYCTCGNRGCAECYAAGHVLRSIWESCYSEEPFEDIFVNHRNDEVMKNFLEAMAIPMASELNIFDPDRVVLGGGVIGMKEFPEKEFWEVVYEFTRKPYPGRDFEIVHASQSSGAGVAGSALYAFEQLDKQNRRTI